MAPGPCNSDIMLIRLIGFLYMYISFVKQGLRSIDYVSSIARKSASV